MTRRLFTATNILFEAQRVRYNSPSARSQRKQLRLAGEELGEAFSDWTKFIEVLSSIADKFKVRSGSFFFTFFVLIFLLYSSTRPS
jgi:hypothetical protein